MQRAAHYPFIAVAAVMLGACVGGSTAPKATINGTWSGSIPPGVLTLTLQQTGTNVTGNGSLAGPGGAAAVTVTGSFTAPSMSLTINSSGFSPIDYTGTVSGKTMTGTMTNSGFVSVGVTLTRP